MADRSNRREFLRDTTTVLGAGLVGLGVTSAAPAAEEKPAASVDPKSEPKAEPKTDTKGPALSEPFVIGIIGTGARGQAVAASFAAVPGVKIKYLCDVDDAMIEKAQASVAKRLEKVKAAAEAKKVKVKKDGDAKSAAATDEKDSKAADAEAEKPEPIQGVKDFRTILEDKSVHGVAIATPDHWHAPAAILACKAGKQVYVEKPCSHNPREGELLIEAARKYNRVVQHGTQRRSWPRVREAIKAVRGGEIGDVHFARAWYSAERKPIGRGKGVPVPANFDYAMWQGPAPERPFQDNLVPYNWHWFWNWGTGEMGNNGIHFLDLARWGLNVEYPKRVTSSGGRYYFSDDQETPDTQLASFDFGDRMIHWEHRSCQPRGIEDQRSGAAFYGDKGTLVILQNAFKVYDLKDKLVREAKDPIDIDADHMADFVDAARKGRRPNADIEDGHKSTLLCHLANISLRTGRTLNIDQKNGHLLDDKDAAESFWSREYNPEWEPKV